MRSTSNQSEDLPMPVSRTESDTGQAGGRRPGQACAAGSGCGEPSGPFSEHQKQSCHPTAQEKWKHMSTQQLYTSITILLLTANRNPTVHQLTNHGIVVRDEKEGGREIPQHGRSPENTLGEKPGKTVLVSSPCTEAAEAGGSPWV